MLGASLWEPPNETVANSFRAFSAAYDQRFFRSFDRQTASASPESLYRYSASALADLITKKLISSEPASFVRLSDGEGNIVALAHPFGARRDLVDYCVRRISYIHFGDHNVVPRASAFFAKAMMAALSSADVVGYAETKSAIDAFDTSDEDLDVRAVFGNRISLLHFHKLLSQNGPVAAASAWFSRGLLPYYGSILRHAKQVTIVSSYPELPQKLASAFDLHDVSVAHIHVPRQAVFLPTNERKDSGHYPEAMTAIVDALKPQQDHALYLVAAGLLGKHYCSVVKQRGGIALDIGSVAEIWMGIDARGLPPSYIAKWRL